MKDEFQPISPPLTYSPAPPPTPLHSPYSPPYSPPQPLPSYLNYWSYFPLKQVTPPKIVNSIRTASEDVYFDGKILNYTLKGLLYRI